MKGNRHTEPQRGVSERNRRVAAALSAEMGSISRSITRRSDQNCKIILQILILQFCRQVVKPALAPLGHGPVCVCAPYSKTYGAAGGKQLKSGKPGLIIEPEKIEIGMI